MLYNQRASQPGTSHFLGRFSTLLIIPESFDCVCLKLWEESTFYTSVISMHKVFLGHALVINLGFGKLWIDHDLDKSVNFCHFGPKHTRRNIFQGT